MATQTRAEEIEHLLSELKQLWLTYPTLRFGQLVSNLTPKRFAEDPFFVLDIEMLDQIRSAYFKWQR